MCYFILYSNLYYTRFLGLIQFHLLSWIIINIIIFDLFLFIPNLFHIFHFITLTLPSFFLFFIFQQKMDFELSSSTLIESFERYKGGNSSTNDQILSKSLSENEEKEREVEVSMMIRALFLFYFSSFYYFHLSFFLVTLMLPTFLWLLRLALFRIIFWLYSLPSFSW